MTEPSAEAAGAIARAVALLRAGELVAFPTETVYGLGADARNPAAVARIFVAKGRPADHPLIVHLPSAAALDAWAQEVPVWARALADACWPGPLTLILRKRPEVPDSVTGGQDTVGLRVPSHPLAQALLQAFGGADGGGLAAPSANRFGRISPTTADHVRDELGDRVALVLDGGPCEVGIESTIVDCSGERPVLLRPGTVSAGRIAAVTGLAPLVRGAVAVGEATASPRAPGTLAAHYAPRTPLALVSQDGLVFALRDGLAARRRSAVLAPIPAPLSHESILWRQAPADPAGFARILYASLRELDAAGCDRIYVQMPPAGEAWQAVRDRLQRAAAGSGVADDDT